MRLGTIFRSKSTTSALNGRGASDRVNERFVAEADFSMTGVLTPSLTLRLTCFIGSNGFNVIKGEEE